MNLLFSDVSMILWFSDGREGERERGLHISLSHCDSHAGLETVASSAPEPGVARIFPGLVCCDLPTARLLVILLEIFKHCC